MWRTIEMIWNRAEQSILRMGRREPIKIRSIRWSWMCVGLAMAFRFDLIHCDWNDYRAILTPIIGLMIISASFVWSHSQICVSQHNDEHQVESIIASISIIKNDKKLFFILPTNQNSNSISEYQFHVNRCSCQIAQHFDIIFCGSFDCNHEIFDGYHIENYVFITQNTWKRKTQMILFRSTLNVLPAL